MPPTHPAERRGQRERGASGLLERGDTLEAIGRAIACAHAGEGCALLIEGTAGIGKTRLHEAALDRARESGMRVLRAAGAELEQDLGFGLAGQLLASRLQDLHPGARADLLGRAPVRLRALAGLPERTDASPSSDLSLSHALFSLLAMTEEPEPTLLAIDDLHWADEPSLGFILYLLHRLSELPVAIVLSTRPVSSAPGSAMDRIATHPLVEIAAPAALGTGAVATLSESILGEAIETPVAEACHRATGGNPFYVRELLSALARENHAGTERLVARALDMAPEGVIRSLRVRVGRTGSDGAGLARAVAVLGDNVPLRQASRLAGLSLDGAATAARALSEIDILLDREPLRFVHPLVRRAIEQDISASELATRHLDAARLLASEGERVERVAAHLLRAREQGSEWVVQQLRVAAREAMARSAPSSAVSYLKRALSEPPSTELRGEVLAQLGCAELAADVSEATDHLEQAVALIGEPRRRAEILLVQADGRAAQGQHELAARCYEQGIAELVGAGLIGPDPGTPDAHVNAPVEAEVLELHDELQGGFLFCATILEHLRAEAARRSESLLARALRGPTTHGERLLLAGASLQASLAGEPASWVIELGERGWDDGRLLSTETADGTAWLALTSAMCMAGALERCVEMTDQVLQDARRRSSPLGFATAMYFRATPLRWQGQIGDALADLERAWDARRYGWQRLNRSAAASYCLCLIETGDLALAEQVLFEPGPIPAARDLEEARRLYALAELRLAGQRHQEALASALESGAQIKESVRVFGYCPWMTVAAQAALALGDRSRALDLAQRSLEITEGLDILHARVRSQRVLGLCQGGEEGLALLRLSVQLGESTLPRLETTKAQLELGAALRRRGERAAARVPLARAADAARRGGATALHTRARVELSAAGARPRREALMSGPGSLTPSERRIAELAAGGQSNREIAGVLFVTSKTVEYHLRNSYRKLDIESRRELASALGS